MIIHNIKRHKKTQEICHNTRMHETQGPNDQAKKLGTQVLKILALYIYVYIVSCIIVL